MFYGSFTIGSTPIGWRLYEKASLRNVSEKEEKHSRHYRMKWQQGGIDHVNPLKHKRTPHKNPKRDRRVEPRKKGTSNIEVLEIFLGNLDSEI